MKYINKTPLPQKYEAAFEYMPMKKSFYIEIFVALAILAALTLPFYLTDLDVRLQSYFYKRGAGWYLAKTQPWDFLYRYSSLPALLATIVALFAYLYSFASQKVSKYSKIALFLVLTMLVGPGIIVNAILKDNYGRPRPRQIVQFDGTKNYLLPWEKGDTGKGKSFPCGHCTMGFYWFAIYFILRNKNRKAAYWVFIVATLYGAALGAARMIQGGHFASDAIWAGGLVYIADAFFYYLLKLDENIFYKRKPEKKLGGRKKYIIAGAVTLILVAILIFAVATPYSNSKKIIVDSPAEQREFVFDVELGDVVVRRSREFSLHWSATGFGFPGSRIKHKIRRFDSVGAFRCRFKLWERGFFTEINPLVKLYLPFNSKDIYTLRLKEGSASLALPDSLFERGRPAERDSAGVRIIDVCAKSGAILRVEVEKSGGQIRFSESNMNEALELK